MTTAQAERERRVKLKVEGRCICCGKETDRPNLYYCSDCLALRNTYKHQKAKECIEKGICPSCGGVLDREGWECKACYKKIKDRIYQLRKDRLAKGLCIQCGKPKINGETTQLCDKCKPVKSKRLAGIG